MGRRPIIKISEVSRNRKFQHWSTSCTTLNSRVILIIRELCFDHVVTVILEGPRSYVSAQGAAYGVLGWHRRGSAQNVARVLQGVTSRPARRGRYWRSISRARVSPQGGARTPFDRRVGAPVSPVLRNPMCGPGNRWPRYLKSSYIVFRSLVKFGNEYVSRPPC